MHLAVAQLIRGFLMGAADVVPGVSGGTIALVLGIYERLIDNIRLGAAVLGAAVRGDLPSARTRLTQVEWLFLIPLLVGILVAVATLAGVIDKALEDHPESMAGFFSGLVAASIIVAWRLLKDPHRRHLVIVAVVGFTTFGLLGFQADAITDPSLIAFFAAGALAICAMILPGISGSFILLMVGMYAPVLEIVSEREMLKVAAVGIGAIVGLALFSTALHRVLESHHDRVLAVMIGLMVGSFRVLWPWPDGVGVVTDDTAEAVDGTLLQWPEGDAAGPIALGVVAFIAVIAISIIGDRMTKRDATPRDVGVVE